MSSPRNSAESAAPKSVWDSIDDSASSASAAAAAASSSSASPALASPAAGGSAAFDPNDGRIRFSCFVPTLAGAGMGGVCGALMAKAQGRPAVASMSFQGAAALGANALASCAMHKATGTSIFEQSQFRAVSFAVTGAVYPVAGEIFARVLPAYVAGVPPVPRTVLVRQTLLFAACGALGGFVLDAFNLGRPVRPGAEPVAPPVPTVVDNRPNRHVPVAGTKRES